MTEAKVTQNLKRPVQEPPPGPFEPPVLTGDETVDEIMSRHPGLRLAMMSYGLCTCCSGGLTLRQTAAVRGIPLGVILADLQHELAEGA